MGNYLCIKRKQKKRIVLLLVGLDNAGKTVTAKNLAGEHTDEVIPTVGFSVVNLKYMNYKVTIYDLGGGSNIRGIWSRYFVDVHGVIFVVDSSDLSRLNEVKEVLYVLLTNEKISGKPLLLLANKQDDAHALDEIDIIEYLNLEHLVNKAMCPTLVQSCSATETSSKSKLDPGIKQGYSWLVNYVIKDYMYLNERVKHDVEEQEIVENLAREKIMQRLKHVKEEERRRQEEDAIELCSDYEQKINGIANGKVLDKRFRENTQDKMLSPIHHANFVDKVITERPKSGTQIVREQLQLEISSKRNPLLKKCNKTAPIDSQRMKLPRSAELHRTPVDNNRRCLKSATDSVFIVSDAYDDIVPFKFESNKLRQSYKLNNYEIHKNNALGNNVELFNREHSISVIELE